MQEKIDSLVAGGASRELSAGERFLNQQDLETDIVSNKNSKTKSGLSTPGSSKIKASHKLRAQTSRIVSSFKTQSIVSSNTREFDGHKDGKHFDHICNMNYVGNYERKRFILLIRTRLGVWQVATKTGQPIIGTASADHLACIWNADNGRCILQYQGHSGSVNSIKFHLNKDLVLTGSGDSTAHIWPAAVNWDGPSSSSRTTTPYNFPYKATGLYTFFTSKFCEKRT